MQDDYEKKLAKAKERVEELRGFYGHLFSYIGVNVVTFLINLSMVVAGATDYWWTLWVLGPWGLGLIMHGMAVFGKSRGVFSQEWEERKIRELMGEDIPKRKNTGNTAQDTYFESAVHLANESETEALERRA